MCAEAPKDLRSGWGLNVPNESHTTNPAFGECAYYNCIRYKKNAYVLHKIGGIIIL